MMLAAALLLAAAPPPPPPAHAQGLAGLYRIQQMEMAGGLELRPNGRFRYALEYGAASEEAEGKWTSDRTTVRLTSDPMPKAPQFVLVRDDPAPKGELWIKVEKAGFGWGGRIDAIATAQGSSERGLVTTNADGRVDSGGRVLTSIEPLVPVYAIPAGRIALSTERGHRLLLRFHANDLGKAAFKGEALGRSGGDLVLKRYDTTIRFVRVRP